MVQPLALHFVFITMTNRHFGNVFRIWKSNTESTIRAAASTYCIEKIQLEYVRFEDNKLFYEHSQSSFFIMEVKCYKKLVELVKAKFIEKLLCRIQPIIKSQKINGVTQKHSFMFSNILITDSTLNKSHLRSCMLHPLKNVLTALTIHYIEGFFVNHEKPWPNKLLSQKLNTFCYRRRSRSHASRRLSLVQSRTLGYKA